MLAGAKEFLSYSSAVCTRKTVASMAFILFSEFCHLVVELMVRDDRGK